MAIEVDIDAARSADGALFVLFRCSSEEATRLAAALRTAYRGKGVPPQVVPAPHGGRFGYCCRIPDSRAGFEQLWPRISLKALLTGGMLAVPSGKAQTERRSDTERRARGGVAPQAQASDPGTSAPLPLAAQPVDGSSISSATPELPPFAAGAAPGVVARAAIEDGRTEATENEAIEATASPLESRLSELQALLEQGDEAAVYAAIAADEPAAALRALRGLALVAAGRDDEALPDLRYAWNHAERRGDVALALARLHWRRGDFDAAAAPYGMAWREGPNALVAQDIAAICELSWSGEMGDLDEVEQVILLQRFCADATPEERNTSIGRAIAERALHLARILGPGDRLVLAYQHLLDVLVDTRDGAGLAALLDRLHDDYWQERVDSAGRFELLDEVTEYQADYAGLRERLIAGYSDIIQHEIGMTERTGEIGHALKDAYRALRRLERALPLVGEARILLAGRRQEQTGDELDEQAPTLTGRRIALVGGHERTREHVRRRLEGWGARVDEVPPPNNGRIAEREIFDKVHQSDLILLIIRYMGHDMSTAVNNLRRREVLRGQVLEIDSRGTSGICREISRWAYRT